MSNKEKSDLSGEAVWNLTGENGEAVICITDEVGAGAALGSPGLHLGQCHRFQVVHARSVAQVEQKFAINLLYQGQLTSKIKVDLVSKSAKLQEFFNNVLQPRLVALAAEAIPTQSTNPSWKGKVSKVEEEMPKLLKEGKAYTKDGVSGRYDPSFSLAVPRFGEEDLKRMEGVISAYVPPPPEEVNKSYSDSAEAYISALRKVPPCTWNIKILDSAGAPLPTDTLLERRTHKGQVMFEIKSLMLKPVRVRGRGGRVVPFSKRRHQELMISCFDNCRLSLTCAGAESADRDAPVSPGPGGWGAQEAHGPH